LGRRADLSKGPLFFSRFFSLWRGARGWAGIEEEPVERLADGLEARFEEGLEEELGDEAREGGAPSVTDPSTGGRSLKRSVSQSSRISSRSPRSVEEAREIPGMNICSRRRGIEMEKGRIFFISSSYGHFGANFKEFLLRYVSFVCFSSASTMPVFSAPFSLRADQFG